MIKSIYREHHWTPDVINNLYFDADDHLGIEFIYDDIRAANEELKSTTKKGGRSN